MTRTFCDFCRREFGASHIERGGRVELICEDGLEYNDVCVDCLRKVKEFLDEITKGF